MTCCESEACIACNTKQDLEKLSPIDRAEFNISQLCPICFDEVTKDDDDDE